jgi:hypothetical protein
VVARCGALLFSAPGSPGRAPGHVLERLAQESGVTSARESDAPGGRSATPRNVQGPTSQSGMGVPGEAPRSLIWNRPV